MKRIVCYILLLFCTLSLSAYGQDKSLFTLPESAEIIDLGSYSDMFTAGDDWDTRQTTDAYRPADWAWEDSPNDVFYKFTLEIPMVVLAAITEPEPGRIYCLEEEADTGYLTPITLMFIPSTDVYAAILQKGVYYYVFEGRTDDKGNVFNGEMNVLIAGLPHRYEVSLGSVSDKTAQQLIGDTRRTSNAYGNGSLNDVFYAFELECPMDFRVSHAGPEFKFFTSYLLDQSEKEIASSASGDLRVEQLPAGNYYLVVECKYEDGIFGLDLEMTPQKTDVDLDDVSGSNGCNYIMTHTYTEADGANKRIRIDYYDGLGRASETIQVGASPLGQDIVSRRDYDALGRLSREWLPRVSGHSAGKFLTADKFEKLSVGMYADDSHTYSAKSYENSPLSRVVSQCGPGRDWYAHAKSVETAYRTNIRENARFTCKRYRISGTHRNPVLTLDGDYETGQLYVTEVNDEDGHVSYEFKNKLGQLLLVRKMAGSTAHDTYYIYDDFGNLCFVLSPRIQDKETPNEGITQDVLDKFAYQYKYDGRQRCIAKKLPGCEWMYYIYDKAGRLIFSQDGNQRQAGEWMFSIPDLFGNECLSGVCLNELDAFATPLDSTVVTADWNMGDSSSPSFVTDEKTYKGYRVSGVFLVSPIVLRVNYYHDYSFLGRNGIPAETDTRVCYDADAVSEGYGKCYTASARGLLTGTLTVQLASNTHTELDASTDAMPYVYSVMYYDNHGRRIQTKSGNHLSGGVESEYLAYDFTGQMTQRKHIHSATGKPVQAEVYVYEYDHDGRLLTTMHQLNGGVAATLADNKYDELGRLASNKRNGQASLKTDYSYNVRSWLTSVSSPLFSQHLHYTDGIGTPCYNGNISSMSWKADNASVHKGYKFSYDGLSRLTDAVYGEGTSLSDNLNRFNEQVTDYDKNGNILRLLRYGQTSSDSYGLVDNLHLVYDGNQLESVSDNVTLSAALSGMEFKDNADLATEYVYDANGNLIKDLNKNIIDIQYNFLNLPCRVKFENGNSISYLYDANGTKLRTTHVIGNDTTVTDYCGNVIYENGAPKTLLVEGGYVSLNDNKYHYFIQDYQGNNRVVADEDGIVEEVNDYYPFGGLMASSVGDVQPYKYNGKELNRKGGLDWYDYGARMYDAALGRWHTVDPSCEKYYNWSPYTYCKNNPVLRIDLDGKDDYVVNEQGKLFNQTPPHMRGKSPTDKLSFSKDLNKFITVKTGLLNSMYKIQKGRQNQGIEYYGSTMNLDDATAIFKFGADNTKVEWKLDIYDNQGEKTAIVGTSGKALSVFADVQDKLKVKGNKIVDLHSHPEHAEASDNDMKLLRVNTGAIYYRDDQKLLFYTSNKSKLKNEEYTVNTSKELLKRLNDKFMK